MRPASTNPAETFGFGVFGGGNNGSLNNFNTRMDIDLELVWQLENLGFGNLARIRGRRAENQAALVELDRTQDRVAADVARAYEMAQSAAERLREAENEVKLATDSADKNFQGLGQTKQAGNVVLLVIRPLEALIAVQALGDAYNDYYGAVADYNRSQFRLYWAIGQPAQQLGEAGLSSPPYCAPPASATEKANPGPQIDPVRPAASDPERKDGR